MRCKISVCSLAFVVVMLVLAPSFARASTSPERCRAIGDMLAKSHGKLAQMAAALLAMGPDNGASEEQLAKLRTRKAEAQQKRDRAAGVARRFSAAKAPDPATITILQNLKFSQLEAELSDCEKTPTSATASDPRLDQRTDYSGNDIRGMDIKGGDWRTCQSMCQAEPRCVVWTLYTPPPGNTGGCWLKHARGRSTANPHSISGTR